MSAQSKTTSPSLAARLVVTKGEKWPLLVSILPRRPQAINPPCGFCGRAVAGDECATCGSIERRVSNG